MLKAIIFDMDGVLIDSTGYNFKSFNKVLEKYDVVLKNTDFLKKHLGRSLRDQLKQIEKDYNLKEEIDHDQFSKEALKYQLEFMKHDLVPNKILHKFIAAAKKKGIKLAVATSSPKERARIILNSLDILNKLDTLVTCDDVIKHKPAPDVFLKAAKNLKVNPKDCVVIEDALNGIKAAKAGKMKSVAKLNKHNKKLDFSNADLIFSDFNKLKLSDLEKLF